MNKIWHKPLHKRKMWKQMSLMSKSIYYVHPFVKQLIYTWLQPIPFPTIFKGLYSCILIVFILLPVIYVITIIILYYGIIQYLLESSLEIRYSNKLDLIHYIDELFKYQIVNEKHSRFVNLYFYRWRYLAIALASCVDYIRLLLSLLVG